MDQQTELLQTALYDLHVELGAKMVPFAGYAMPVQYPLGVKANIFIPAPKPACLMSLTWGRCA